jgi:hypothetical protein
LDARSFALGIAKRGNEMTRSFEIPESLLRRAEELAREDGVSLDIWITSALAQKIGAVETAEEFFKRRSQGAGKGLDHYLGMVPNVSPDPGDELPEGWTPQ